MSEKDRLKKTGFTIPRLPLISSNSMKMTSSEYSNSWAPTKISTSGNPDIPGGSAPCLQAALAHGAVCDSVKQYFETVAESNAVLPQRRLERPTYGLGNRCSILLSY